MNVLETALPGVLIVEPDVHGDARGYFLETFHRERYAAHGIPGEGQSFAQDNHSRSRKGVLRGLHFQLGRPQGKLVWASAGAVFDVAADVNPDSPTFGQWVGVELGEANHRQIWIPPGYAHGFCALTDVADVHYKCTAPYDPAADAGVAWDDPLLAIDWPVASPLLSDKDRALPCIADAPRERLPR